jgi:gliding motility-associated-like protein
MKKIIAIFLSLSINTSFGQNLVPNPGFEIYDTCPDFVTQIHYAPPWYAPTKGTPDYFNTCVSGSSLIAVPSNVFGYENPRTGNAYAGILGKNFFDDTMFGNVREYLQVKLDSSLVAGQKYYVSFFITLADNMRYASDDIGAYFSSDSLVDYTQYALSANPQLQNPVGNYLIKKNEWMQVCGSFVASGGENYLSIGNFNMHSGITTYAVSEETQFPEDYNGSYYFIDDIYVSDDSIAFDYYHAEINVSEINILPSEIFIPNVFTPDDNGENDYFKLNDKWLNTYKMKIYDRWGLEITELDKNNPIWDGSFHGVPCSGGTYFYLLSGEGLNSETINKKGYLLLLK